jgi:hypothetical protein
MDYIPIDYETLRLIWWALLGIILIGFAILGGRDLGIGALLPAVARTDDERRVLLNLVGPTWEGNQVWLVLGGGAIFAAWPPLYAVSFSGFYLAMIVILFALILRPVGFKYRGKVTDPRWRSTWDWVLFIGGFVPALIFGVAIGNALLGAPFDLDTTLRPSYLGNFFGLLTRSSPRAPRARLPPAPSATGNGPRSPPSCSLHWAGSGSPLASRAMWSPAPSKPRSPPIRLPRQSGARSARGWPITGRSHGR